MTVFENIFENISNLISVHMDGLVSDVTLVEIELKPQSTSIGIID